MRNGSLDTHLPALPHISALTQIDMPEFMFSHRFRTYCRPLFPLR